MKLILLKIITIILLFSACASDKIISNVHEQQKSQEAEIKGRFLALGDSYTTGQSVEESERWPNQLAELLGSEFGSKPEVVYRARTGWTSSDLLAGLDFDAPDGKFDFASLLIGVNNQYRNYNFQIFQRDVPDLINRMLRLVEGKKDRIFIVSIPDYAYTPFGQRQGEVRQEQISVAIGRYNDWLKDYATREGIGFIYITDITENGLSDPELVAGDGLHPSGKAYELFAKRILKQYFQQESLMETMNQW
jgi:acyl-CoA thioesterase-1